MYSARATASSRSQYGVPPSSHRSAAASGGEPPLTAERAMMDQIRSKLERAQRRLARNAALNGSQGSSSSVSSRYIPSSEYGSMLNRPPVKSVYVEDMPATASKNYRSSSSFAPPPSTARQPPPSRQGVPPSTNRRPPPSNYAPSSRHQSRYPDASKYAQQQYQSRSKYSHSNQSEADPLNGGPPPMSTPFLVYSSSRPPMTGSSTVSREHHVKSSKVPPSSKPSAYYQQQQTDHREQHHTRDEDKKRHRVPVSSNIGMMMNGPPSAMRSGLPRPPSSRVRFEGHEPDGGAPKAKEKLERESEAEKKRRQQQREREIAHRQLQEQRRRHHKQNAESNNALAQGVGPSSPIAATPRGRRATSIENPPSSAIKLSAYEEVAQAIPESPAGRPRRSSLTNPPPKSDIKVSAFDDMVPRRRSSAPEHPTPPTSTQPKGNIDKKADADQGLSSDEDNENLFEPTSPVPGPEAGEPVKIYEDEEDTSDLESDESDVHDFSDFDVNSELGYLSSATSDFDSFAPVGEEEDGATDEVEAGQVDSNDTPSSDSYEAESADQFPQVEETLPSPPTSELPQIEEEVASSPRITARDLAFLALGRSSSSFSDVSPASSANGKASPKYAPAPTSYAPASSAFPRSRGTTRNPIPATTGRSLTNHLQSNGVAPPAPATAGSGYIRRSRARAPMDLKKQLPPSIGVLSGLSSGPATFVMDPSCFYEVVWKTGEFAFSLQRVHTEENEFEFDDSNQEPQLFLRMLLNTDRSTCKSFRDVRVGDVLIKIGATYVSELGLEGSGSVLTKFFAKLAGQTPIKLTFQRMCPSEWEGGVEL
ncbi:hypothetical protein BBJ28_00006479 [Nothophytophthora sp. Chile5]|nr:hypothetical protein BBJ28_00006479 [Nothophytophthora sp. Chile5]